VAFPASDPPSSGQAFVCSHIGWRQIATMNHDPLRFPASESGMFRDCDMDLRGIHVGDAIHSECSFMGQRHALAAVTGARPQDRLTVLRQPIGWKIRNAVDPARSVPVSLVASAGPIPSPRSPGHAPGSMSPGHRSAPLAGAARLSGNACFKYQLLRESCTMARRGFYAATLWESGKATKSRRPRSTASRYGTIFRATASVARLAFPFCFSLS